jgi:FKBP-type peptidyl-prolyl cis-trans isomerase FkpA
MKHFHAFAACAALALGAGAAPAQTPESDDDKVAYTVGYLVAEALTPFDFTDEELVMVLEGMRARVAGTEPPFDPSEYRDEVIALRDARMQAELEARRAESRAYLDAAAEADGARRTDSGLVFEPLAAGDGARPAASDTVVVHYEGKLTDGTTFDSSRARGQPATFPLNGVIACWTEALQMMRVGGRARLTCPAEIAYGDRGAPPRIPPGAVLVFDVELLDIQAPGGS